MTFDQQLKAQARESADRYVRKGQCDKVLARARPAGDPAFVEEIERRCTASAAP